MNNKILLFGEVLFDIINGEEYIGGAPFNVFVNLSRLGADAEFISRIGKDRLGEKILSYTDNLGLSNRYIEIDKERPTGFAKCTIGEDGSATYMFPEEDAYSCIEYPENLDKEYDAFYFGSWSQKGEISMASVKKVLENHKFGEIFFDLNIRRDFFPEDYVRYAFSKATILKINDEEAERIAVLLYKNFISLEDTARKIASEFDVKIVCITKGGDGYGILYNGKYSEHPAKKVEVCDTIGAGDAFSAAFLANYLKTNDIIDSGKKAAALGSFVASKKSAIPDLDEEIKKELEI